LSGFLAAKVVIVVISRPPPIHVSPFESGAETTRMVEVLLVYDLLFASVE